jgi:small subunit ribosomal protein S7
MSRRRRITKKQILPDPKFNNVLASRFMNCLMKQGKKSVAEHIFYRAVDLIGQRTGQSGIEVFQVAVEKVKPMVMVRSRRVGGATYQVPLEVRPEERTSRSIKWLIRFASERSERTMAERLANELIAASKGEGGAIRQRDDVHRMAEANKAFAHYRF